MWHELSHVYVLTATHHRVPRWFTEGMAVYEETAVSPEWGDRIDPQVIAALKHKKMLPVAELDVLLDAFAAKPTAVLELVTTSAPWFGPLPLALARLPREVLTLLSPEAVAAVPKAEFAELLPVATLISPTAALLDAPCR